MTSPGTPLTAATDVLDRWLDRASRFANERRRPIAGALSMLLVGFGAAAFGIAPRTPTPDALPQRLVVEQIEPDLGTPQLELLSERGLRLYRHELTRAGDTADTLLRRLGADDPEAAAFLRRDRTARRLIDGRAGKMVQAEVTESGRLLSLVARYPSDEEQRFSTHFNRLSLRRDGDMLSARLEEDRLMPQVRLAGGSIRSTLFAATDEAGLPDAIGRQLGELFATDIDFRRGLRRGDSFTVAYEALTADGEPITWDQAAGRLLAAEFLNDGTAYSAVWFQGSDGKGGYFGLDGQSKRRAFLSSPLEYSRMTSGFSMRFHPILQDWRAHRGVDYAAPTGTPVRAVGDGVVEFAGWQNGYGNVVEIQHAQDRSTTYAHLSRIDVRQGQRIGQGQTVGAVGMTGWATGPHLHFEFKVAGEERDPLSIAKASEALTIAPADQARFAAVANATRAQLDAAGNATGIGLAE